MSIKKLQYVDAARGIAILMVIMVHTAQTIEGLSLPIKLVARYGQMGVQLFFLASAYTLCRAFVQRRGESMPLMAFFIRRFFRIAPLYYVGIGFYLTFDLLTRGWDVSGAMALGPYTLKNILANALFFHGFVISANNNIVPGGWSIGTEMAFYVVFPTLFLLFTRLRDWGTHFVWAAFVVSCVISVSFAFLIRGFEQGVVYRDFFSNNLVNQLPVFAIGMASFFIQDHEGTLPAWMKSGALQGIGFLLFTWIAFYFWESDPSFMFAIKPIIVGLSFFFLFNLLRLWPRPSALLCVIGRVSFSMYMFHAIFAKFLLGVILAKLALPFSADLVFVVSFTAVCAVTLCIAIVTERTIEKHGIRLGNALIARVRSQEVLS